MSAAESPWRVLLGHAADGAEVWRDLSSAPHILLCGTSGSGKSVGVSALLCGLVTAGTPRDTRIVIADPKRVEFGPWRRVPHVERVATDRESIRRLVAAEVAEMDRRYATMERRGVRDVSGLGNVPRRFFVCDELADLTMRTRDRAANRAVDEILAGLTRIAQLGRAAGIHLILATQRPASDTLPGNLRANLGTRWAFRVRTRTESRIALDAPGAESLGSAPGTSLVSWRGSPGEFVQGLYVRDEDIAEVIARVSGRAAGGPGGSLGQRAENVLAWIMTIAFMLLCLGMAMPYLGE